MHFDDQDRRHQDIQYGFTSDYEPSHDDDNDDEDNQTSRPLQIHHNSELLMMGSGVNVIRKSR